MSAPEVIDINKDGTEDIVFVINGDGVYALDGGDIGDPVKDLWYYPDISFKTSASIVTLPFENDPYFAVVNYNQIYLLNKEGSISQIVDTIHEKYSSEIVALDLLGVSPTEYVLIAVTDQGDIMALDNPMATMPTFDPLSVEADTMDDKTSLETWKERGSVLILGVIPIIAVVVLLRKKK